MPPLRILSLGAGVQSTTLLLMALAGEFAERPDYAIFADTGWEPKAVYKHLGWLETYATKRGIPVRRVSAGNLKEDVLRSLTGSRIANPPFFVKSPLGTKAGMLTRQCTRDYKVIPIRREVRRLSERRYGVKHLERGCVEQWFGISLDEYQRMRTSDVKYITHRYPLVDRRMTRLDCINWLRKHGFPVPPKSACLGCPFRSDAGWREIQKDQSEWDETVAFDRAIRRGIRGVKGEAYLHRSLIPLDLVDFRSQPTLFGDECSGHCGV